MKAQILIGVLLLLFGAWMLGEQGLSFTKRERFGGLGLPYASAGLTHPIVAPSAVALSLLAALVALIAMGNHRH